MTPTLSSEAIVARNLGVVDAHFHNENPVDIDKAIDLYGDTIVWEVPARGVLLRDKAAVKDAYLKIFESYQIHSMTPVRRFGTGNVVIDDTVADRPTPRRSVSTDAPSERHTYSGARSS